MATKLSAVLLGSGQGGSEVLRFLAEAAYLWSYRGEQDKAAEIFEALTVLAPDDPVGHLGLAEALTSQGKHREAEKAAEQATRCNEGDRRTMAFAYKLRGKALMQMNKAREAEKAWQRAAELDAGGAEGKSASDLVQIARKLGLLSSGAAPRVK